MKYIFHNARRLDKKVGLVLFVLFLSVISGGCGRQSINGDLNHEGSGNEAESSNGMTELSAEADDEDTLVSKALLNICISEDERVCIPDPSEEKEQYSIILHNAPNEFYDDEDEDDNDFDPDEKDAIR